MIGQNSGGSQSPNRPAFVIASLVLTVFLVLSTVSGIPVALAQDDTQTFTVEQGNKCVQIAPLGDGSQSVENFYDYRSAITEPQGLYSSYGTQNIQLNQVSQLFVYDGSNGTSLVFLHDKMGAEEGGFVATADISGLPENGTWAVRDDYYRDRQDDIFNTNLSGGQQAHIEWLSNHNRTDGAAFRGIGNSNYDSITIDIKFNSRSDNYPFIKWRGPPEENEIERWITRSGTGETTSLNLNQSIRVSPGECPEGSRSNPASGGGPDTPQKQNGELFSNSSSGDFTVTATPTPAGLFSNSSNTRATTTTETPTATSTPTQTATPSPTPTATATPTPTPSQTASPSNGSGAGVVESTTQPSQNSNGSSAFGPGFGIGLALVAIIGLGMLGLAGRHR